MTANAHMYLRGYKVIRAKSIEQNFNSKSALFKIATDKQLIKNSRSRQKHWW